MEGKRVLNEIKIKATKDQWELGLCDSLSFLSVTTKFFTLKGEEENYGTSVE